MVAQEMARNGVWEETSIISLWLLSTGIGKLMIILKWTLLYMLQLVEVVEQGQEVEIIIILQLIFYHIEKTLQNITMKMVKGQEILMDLLILTLLLIIMSLILQDILEILGVEIMQVKKLDLILTNMMG